VKLGVLYDGVYVVLQIVNHVSNAQTCSLFMDLNSH